jgi:predicted nucleotidyltransferase
MNKIVYMKFGSHLYGTNTPDSDIDYKGIYLPTKRQLLLSNFPKCINTSTGNDKSKNTSLDVDDEIFSLHQFIKLACEGQTVALDMLHAPKEMIIESSHIWDEIVANRNMFYTKNLTAFTGYCRKQAAKYGIKGSRLNDAKKVIAFLHNFPNKKMIDIWSDLPEGEHIHFLEPNPRDKHNCKIYQVCGKKFLEMAPTSSAVESLNHFVEAYGYRAERAAKNEGIDWKAISHAIRAAYQLEEIYEKGTITFPLIEAKFIKDVKKGKLDYLTQVEPKLEDLMERTEALSKKTELPKTVDLNYWNNFIYNTIEESMDIEVFTERRHEPTISLDKLKSELK